MTNAFEYGDALLPESETEKAHMVKVLPHPKSNLTSRTSILQRKDN